MRVAMSHIPVPKFTVSGLAGPPLARKADAPPIAARATTAIIKADEEGN